MAISERTKKLRKYKYIFGILSYATFIIVGIVSIIIAFASFDLKKDGIPVFSPEFKALLTSMGTTTIIGIIIAILIKDKLRTLIYMISLIIVTVVYKEVGMYIVLGIWAIDEYVFSALYKYFSNKLSINKEIDLRG